MVGNFIKIAVRCLTVCACMLQASGLRAQDAEYTLLSGDFDFLAVRNIKLSTIEVLDHGTMIFWDGDGLHTSTELLRINLFNCKDIPKNIALPDDPKFICKIKDMGKYYPKIVWWKNGDVTRWYGDALANEKNHVTSPWALKLLDLTTDFTEISKNYVFNTPAGDFIRPTDLRQVSLTIDMLAKGKLFKNTFDSSSPVNVRTYMELYLTEREFLSEKEAKELKKEIPSIESSDIWAPTNANPLHPAIRRTVERVNSL